MEKQNWKQAARAFQADAIPQRTGIIQSSGAVQHTFPCLLQFCARSGLCNRLRGWVGIGTLADIFNLTFLVHWKGKPACGSTFTNVFEADTCAVMPSQRSVGKFNILRRFTDLRSVQNTEVYRGMMDVPDKLFWDRAKQRARELKLLPHLTEQLEEFMKTLPAGIIGLHVRRTDLISRSKADPRLHAVLDDIVAEAAAKDEEVNFLLCADNPKSVTSLKQRYGKRIFWRDQDMGRRANRRPRCTTQANAAIDLYSLSRTERIIGTRRSSFSGYAAFLGGIALQPV